MLVALDYIGTAAFAAAGTLVAGEASQATRVAGADPELAAGELAGEPCVQHRSSDVLWLRAGWLRAGWLRAGWLTAG